MRLGYTNDSNNVDGSSLSDSGVSQSTLSDKTLQVNSHVRNAMTMIVQLFFYINVTLHFLPQSHVCVFAGIPLYSGPRSVCAVSQLLSSYDLA